MSDHHLEQVENELGSLAAGQKELQQAMRANEERLLKHMENMFAHFSTHGGEHDDDVESSRGPRRVFTVIVSATKDVHRGKLDPEMFVHSDDDETVLATMTIVLENGWFRATTVVAVAAAVIGSEVSTGGAVRLNQGCGLGQLVMLIGGASES
ncbi:hypothetical protein F0562_019766 [Nyssa sinensis]|uniref:Uncharacterized protein n=1 Tax=Nyssa sinensis TaxID=561372 RepID=A0A5J5BTB3_9ASTE|nr:hypothetical protein F0562_019766 [Nyssa sinensis]